LRAEGATASDFDASVASLLDLRAEITAACATVTPRAASAARR